MLGLYINILIKDLNANMMLSLLAERCRSGQSNVSRYFTVSGESEFETELSNHIDPVDWINGALGGAGATENHERFKPLV